MQTKLIKIPLITLVLLGLVAPTVPLDQIENRVSASDLETAQESLPEPLDFLMPGRIEGTGTYFEIKDSEYLNITLESTEEIRVVLESIPRMISLDLEAATDTINSTTLTIEGLGLNKTYYKYQDSYKAEAVFISDENGSYGWTQDLSQPHHIWLQEEKGTIFLPEQCSTYGVWDASTSTCTLIQDLNESVGITQNNITLDCNGHSITGTGSGYGVYLYRQTGITLRNCIVNNFSYGIYLLESSGSSIINSITTGTQIGIRFYNSSNNNLLGDTANSNNYYGILIQNNSNNNIVSNNTTNLNNLHGLTLHSDSNNNTLSNNTANSNNEHGIDIYLSNNNTLTNNTMSENKYNFYLLGYSDDHFLNNIETSNTVNGKPVYYIKNTANQTYDASTNAGTFYCISCDSIILKDLTLTNNGLGIFLWKTNNSRIENIISSNNLYSILLQSSNNNTIISNAFNSNDYYGIILQSSSNNNIFNNTVSLNKYQGIILYSSDNNKIYHNNFLDNYEPQAHISGGIGNLFDNGYPDGGNYWSDYTGVDFKSGPNQEQPGSDGIGDAPYTFTGGQDKYPFMKENGWEIVNQPPIISNLEQFKSDGILPITEGDTTTESVVAFKVTLEDPDKDPVKLQVELRQIAESFIGIDDGGILSSDFVDSGSEVTINREGLVNGQYHWRARAVDEKGATSDWQEFGEVGNVDFGVKLVPFYTQVRSPYPSDEETFSWFNEFYADGEVKSYTCGSKIRQCGCAITSVVMIARYYDVTEAQGKDVNPKEINEWLKSEPGGYQNGDVNWIAAAKYTGWQIKYEKTDKTTNNYVLLDEYLNKNQPVIAKEISPGHFIVIDNKLATTYGVKDPSWYDTKKLDESTTDWSNKIRDYNNNFYGLRIYKKGDGIAQSAITFALGSPAELLITDPHGRKLGKDVNSIEYNEIPDAWYFEDGFDDPTGEISSSQERNKLIQILESLAGEYKLEVIGTGAGGYTLQSTSYDIQGNSQNQEFHSETAPDHVAQYNLSYDSLNSSNTVIKLFDETPPEAIISFNPIVQKLIIQGTDNTTVNPAISLIEQNKETTYQIQDEAENTTKIFFKKFKQEGKEIKAELKAIQYNDDQIIEIGRASCRERV